ncbi:MAG: hypothetical protein E7580_02885 [Ruminococcaceae bacterium]|nr:hypothetical protein [Oscillospiraceae bacterium]
MIGVSLPVALFAPGAEEERRPILNYLKQEGVASIELRTVRASADPAEIRLAMETVWSEGFLLTVHGEVKSEESCVRDVFSPLSEAFPLKQKRLNVTVHPIVGDNAAVLCALSDYVRENGLPVTISLENNRRLPDKTEGDSAALVLDAVKRADRDNVGVCFDMGHYAYYVKKNLPEAPDTLPPDEFWKYVTHTHIHATKALRTHYPLDGFDLPLKQILEKLTWGYYGVYNIEPDFPRLKEEFSPVEVLKRSVPTLKNALFPTARLYDRIRNEFDRSFLQALSVKERKEGTCLGLVHAASYLFSTNGYFWGMDLAFRACYALSETPHQVSELLKELKLMVVTHGHRDHFEERTVRALAGNDTLWLIPDFLEEKALSFGLKKEKMILAKKGEAVTVGPLTFLPFESRHFRPVTGKGVKEYGYYVTAEGEPSLAFPGDIRDYEDPSFPFENAQVCFSHIWYSDDNRKTESAENVLPLAKFALAATNRKILLCHLYENGRPDHVMWRMEHAEQARKEILNLSPETEVVIPDWGEVLQL